MYNFSSISKHRNLLFGIATLWIACFHSYNVDFTSVKILNFLNIGSLLESLKFVGNCGVDVFLFLSGVGLYFSFSNNPDIPSFYRRRLLRIIPSSLVISLIISILSPIENIWHFLARITFLEYFVIKSDSWPFWYVSSILLLYLLFPLFYHLIQKLKVWGAAIIIVSSVIITICVFFIDYEYLYQMEMLLTRIPVFVIGILFAPLIKKEHCISNVKALIICLSGLLYFPLMLVAMGEFSGKFLFIKHYFYCPLAIFFVIIVSFICCHIKHSFLSKPLEFLGSYSLEVYLIHPTLYSSMSDKVNFFMNHQILYAFIIMAVALILSIILKYSVNKVISLFKKAEKGT